ncbi:MAG: hypothetical protein RXO54_04065 [Acidilobus sp.]
MVNIDEIIDNLKKRRDKVELELQFLNQLISIMEGQPIMTQDLKIVENKIYDTQYGINFILAKFVAKIKLSDDAVLYLNEVVDDIREMQRNRWGVSVVDYATKSNDDGTISSIIISGLSSAVEFLNAKNAIETAVEMSMEDRKNESANV